MNCKKVEPLLSLYVGGDLEEERSRPVAAHLQSCTECTLAAKEYAAATQLLKRYDAPVFSDRLYAGIREQVLNEIERDSHARVWPGNFSQLFSALVQPRMRWVTAALLLAICATVLYLSRSPSRQLTADTQVAVVRSEERKEPVVSSSSSSSNNGQARPANKRRPSAGKRPRAVGISQPSPAPAPLRMEMQTSNRNIRIIWLSDQRPGALGRDGSKGI